MYIVQYYNSLYAKQFSWQLVRLRLIGWRVFEEGEVFEVIKAFNSNKARAPRDFL